MAVPSVVHTHISISAALLQAYFEDWNRSGIAKGSRGIILHNKAYKG